MKAQAKIRQENYPGMFNLTKGILMLVVMASHALMYTVGVYHVNQDRPIMFWIRFITYASMPAFFMICGYTIKKKPRKACIKAQKVLLKPYALVTVSVFVVSMVPIFMAHGRKRAYWDVFLRKVFPYFLGLNGRPFFEIKNDGIGALWFFLAYVLGSIVLNEILWVEDRFSQIVILTAMALISVEIGSEAAYPFYIPEVLICTGYMYAGMLCKKYDIFNREIPLATWGLIVAGWLYMTKYSEIFIASNSWKNGMSDVLLSYGAGLGMLVAFQKLNLIQGGIGPHPVDRTPCNVDLLYPFRYTNCDSVDRLDAESNQFVQVGGSDRILYPSDRCTCWLYPDRTIPKVAQAKTPHDQGGQSIEKTSFRTVCTKGGFVL